MLLFFKEIYRNPILAGDKIDTIRLPKRLPKIQSIVHACVGPSRVFARLRILTIEPIGSLSPERLAQVEACYGAIDPAMVRLTFRLE